MHSASTIGAAARRKIEYLLFVAAFFAYGFFHQGGGWAQNARFAMVRALVEQCTYSIDHYLIYMPAETVGGEKLMVRVPVSDATFELGGRTYALMWHDAAGREALINSSVKPGTIPVDIDLITATGDLSYARGHFYSGKAPGASLLAALPYFVVYHLEELFGVDPDNWWTLTINAWLTTVFGVGLISAFGCVLVFRLALASSGGWAVPGLLTAITFALGTMFFPLATLLQDQNLAAVLLLASFYLLQRVKEADSTGEPFDADTMTADKLDWWIALSGLCAGFAAITNYVAAVAVVALGAYLLWGMRRQDGWKWFALGVAGPLLLISAHNLACFGAILSTNYRYQNILFGPGIGVCAGMLMTPRWDVLLTILFSPFRGLFFTAPILLVGVYGLFSLFRCVRWRAEACLFASLIGLYLCFNASFRGWHAGSTSVPRYLGPVIPFLAIPMVFGFVRFPKISHILAAVSIVINLLLTAVEPQAPTEFNATPGAPVWAEWRNAPLFDYVLPMFLTGRAGGGLDRLLEAGTRRYAAQLDAAGIAPHERDRLLAARRRELDIGIKERKILGSNGPVSGNPIGVYEGWFHSSFPDASRRAEWNSFNLGEFIFPQSRLSLLPLALVCGSLLSYALVIAHRARTRAIPAA